MEHTLKTWPEYMIHINDDQKQFEVRKNDRDFQVGDTVILEEFDPNIKGPDKMLSDPWTIRVEITYVLHGGQFGIEPGYCVFGFKKLKYYGKQI